jgi:hypothetical protein
MSKISNPTDNSKLLTDDELEQHVKHVLEPLVNKFVENHQGKEITKSDIEELYKNLSDNLSKDPRITDKWSADKMHHGIREQMAGATAEEIQKDKGGISDKLIQGFGDFCNKIGFKQMGTACMKRVQKSSLRNQLDRIAKDVTSTKMIYESVGQSDSAKISSVEKRLEIMKDPQKAHEAGMRKAPEPIMQHARRDNRGRQ